MAARNGTVATEYTSSAQCQQSPVDHPPALATSNTAPATARLPGTGWDAETAGKVLGGVLERAELPFRLTKKGGDYHYRFKYCPNTPDPDGQHSHECAIIVRAGARIGVHCRHDADATWLDFKYLIGWFDHAPQVVRERGIAPRSCPYRVTDAGLVYLRRSRGRLTKVRLTNFSARILRDVEADDGVETRHTFELEAQLHGKTTRFTLSAPQFAAMNWPLEQLGARAVLFPGAKPHLRTAIQLLSGEVQPEKRYKHLGWRCHDGQMVYLHAGGGTGAHGLVPGIQVDLPDQLVHY